MDDSTREAVPAFDIRSVMDALHAPMFLIDARSALMHASPAGRAMLERADCVVREGRRVVCRDGESQQAFEDGLRAAGRTPGRVVVAIKTVRGLSLAATLSGLRERGPGSSRALNGLLVAIADHRMALPDADELSAGFRLTAAEARIARVICEGKSPHECAEALRVKVSTVRTHLASIYRKTGTGRQIHLARLILPLAIL